MTIDLEKFGISLIDKDNILIKEAVIWDMSQSQETTIRNKIFYVRIKKDLIGMCFFVKQFLVFETRNKGAFAINLEVHGLLSEIEKEAIINFIM